MTLPFDENDDEFDWEAAVKEIEVTCSKADISFGSLPPQHAHSSSNNIAIAGDRKQPTLDKFILNYGVVRSERNTDGDADGDQISSVRIDAEAANTWIYPINVPLRDYQFFITQTALFSNTLVALPTGLGKTLIAAVVMYNYYRWFPDGKIVFAAPSRPLVLQQIEACHNIVGIPQEWTIDLTGQMNPTKRAALWKTKRVFFVTPQVLENDIKAGHCFSRNLVCLVVDEAHRALGNYSYCGAIRELMAVPVKFRILALTATPGSKQPTIQQIIDNLHISTLEYRSESDPDVIPYVHDRKIELVEVPLGRDAANVTKILLDVIRPYVARLSSMGVHLNRDYQALSPPDLLKLRENFRQAPPHNLCESKYGEVEAYIGGLITLLHIRKLLSSHGIKPAHEMLEEKLKQGSFARLMSKNESIAKIQLVMRQSVSHGAPSPKLSKMLQILVDHFNVKDPNNSRVIIFSNYRGSVRDILDSLTSIGDLVRATEFIGQSSGKHLKGQSQKVQQAVLQKFRAGEYNVIVATSIGEEGLDIMEVDLVICFDANVSPLRMIQRMGRTGRKHDGRVVVLACEGSELKGYTRKQANSRTMKKLLNNGGNNSFNFHSSPRMVPHTFKPEVSYVELFIKQYIPRGKEESDRQIDSPCSFPKKLTREESAILTKYFQSSTWRPSLIAFPYSQALPTEVFRVMHSLRTKMLVKSMQLLRCLSVSKTDRAMDVEDDLSTDKCEQAAHQEDTTKDAEEVKDKIEVDLVPVRAEMTTLSQTPENHCCNMSNSNTPDQICLNENFPENFQESELDCLVHVPEVVHSPAESNGYSRDNNLSPRLSNLIESGIVPESPVNVNRSEYGGAICYDTPERVPTSNCGIGLLRKLPDPKLCTKLVQVVSSPEVTMLLNPDKILESSPVTIKEPQNPMSPVPDESSSKKSCSENWLLSCEGMPQSNDQGKRLKRLRKVGDHEPVKKLRKCLLPILSHAGVLSDENVTDKKKGSNDFMAFIDEEADVSSTNEASSDETCEEQSSYDNSFIDDRISPTVSTTQAESSRLDMQAFYRRSLLSQTQFRREFESAAVYPDSSPTPERNTIVRFSGKTSSPSTSASDVQHLGSLHRDDTCSKTASERDADSKLSSRTRRLSFVQSHPFPSFDLENEEQGPLDDNGGLIGDDQFFANVDLDAVEERAAFLLRQKSQPNQAQPTLGPQNIPSFDLGI